MQEGSAEILVSHETGNWNAGETRPLARTARKGLIGASILSGKGCNAFSF